MNWESSIGTHEFWVRYSVSAPMAQRNAPPGPNFHETVDAAHRPTGPAFDTTIFRLFVPLIRSLIRSGSLAICYRDNPGIMVGDGDGDFCLMQVDKTRFLRRALAKPDLAVGEGYMEGEWRLRQGDLATFIGRLLSNQEALLQNPIFQALTALQHWLFDPHRRNEPSRSRRNAAHHYDLGNDLYAAFLDEGMNYSCAFFETPAQSLRDAQINKLRTSIRRLDIRSGMSVLDIGCGWGELTRRITQETDAGDVVGITLAERQYALARDRAAAVQSNRLTYRLEDYRDFAATNPERFDRIVSIGMFEHVGRHQFADYFGAIKRMLKPGGRALVHSIVRPAPGTTSPWIDRYIFPGGYIPHHKELTDSGVLAGLTLERPAFVHQSFHYANTLRHWRQRFNARNGSLDSKKYDARFRRMWNFYLAASEAAFDASGYYVAQALFRKEPL